MALRFNKTFRYIDDLLSINICNFGDFVSEINPPELRIKNTTVFQTETSYLDTKINIGKGTEGIKTSIYDKREDFIFGIINFDSNIPKNPQDLMKPKPIIVELHTI